jgi:hypothetical protein
MRTLLPLLAALSCLPALGQWNSLFDGKQLDRWKETAFSRKGVVAVEDGAIVLRPGEPMTGVTWSGEFPRTNYEIRFEAARLRGNDFFATVTFPVGDSYCSWVMGGWGGDIIGLSSIDGWDASENETRAYFNFDNGKWYRLRLVVTPEYIRAWIDDERVINASIAGRTINLRRGEINLSTPLGFASYATEGAVRKIEYRTLSR